MEPARADTVDPTGSYGLRRSSLPLEILVSVSRIGRLVLGLGVLVGGAAGIGLLAGFEPARLPPALLNIAVYKLMFVSALAILAAGAVMLRHARRWEGRTRDGLPIAPGHPGLGLPPGNGRDGPRRGEAPISIPNPPAREPGR